MKRHGQRLGLRPDRLADYQRHHARIWPEIAAAIHAAGIRNYSIFHFQGELFGYYEYLGPPADYAARMAALAKAPRMREWWAEMEEVFHVD